MRESRIGELAIGRAAVLLKAEGIDIELVPIRHHPDEAGLIGAAHLAPAWMFDGHDASSRSTSAAPTSAPASSCTNAEEGAGPVARPRYGSSDLWRHRDDEPKPTRDEAVERLVDDARRPDRQGREGELELAPFIGVGCPGLIDEDGSIERGGQNLPGNWESSRFNLPRRAAGAMPEIGEHETMVVMHNDAVVQGLSEVPFMQDVERWGVLTIGTGLGNARFTNRAPSAARTASGAPSEPPRR